MRQKKHKQKTRLRMAKLNRLFIIWVHVNCATLSEIVMSQRRTNDKWYRKLDQWKCSPLSFSGDSKERWRPPNLCGERSIHFFFLLFWAKYKSTALSLSLPSFVEVLPTEKIVHSQEIVIALCDFSYRKMRSNNPPIQHSPSTRAVLKQTTKY